MKQWGFHYLIMQGLLFWGAAEAIEIPVKDLTLESSPPSLAAIPRATPVHPGAVSPPTKPALKLELALREIQLLRKAAQCAGGDLEVIIRPTGGITAEELVVPLAQTGAFEIKPGQSPGSIKIESKPQTIPRDLKKTENEKIISPSLSPKREEIPTLILK